jgi:hypothetical protein
MLTTGDDSMSNELSLNDVVMPRCYTRALWVYDYKIDDLDKLLVEFLRQYCPVAFSKLVYDANKTIHHGRFIECTTNETNIFSRTDQLDVHVEHYLHCSFQQLNVFPYDAIPTDDSPLFFLHQVHLNDGTLLAFGMHHHFVDGHGFFTLIDRFSRWIRNRTDSTVKTLITDRSLLKPADDIRYEHIEYTTIPRDVSWTALPPMDVVVRRWTKRSLFDRLKITSNIVSFNDVLVAWLTQTISRIRRVSIDETVHIGMASNGRQQLELSSDYIGNCNFYMCLQLTMNDLHHHTINQLAEQINVQKKQYTTRDYMTSALAWVKAATKPVLPAFHSFCGKDLAFTNWSRFPAYDIDFGHGRPKRVALPPARFDGLVLILPTGNDELELYIGLKQDHADEFIKQCDQQ